MRHFRVSAIEFILCDVCSCHTVSYDVVADPVAPGAEQTGQLREGGVNVTSSGTSGTSNMHRSSLTEGSSGVTTTEVGHEGDIKLFARMHGMCVMYRVWTLSRLVVAVQ